VNSVVTAETAVSLDEVAAPGPELVAAAARLLDELGTSLGIAEMGQFSIDGEIRRRYWKQPANLIAWAERHGVTVTEAVITDV
jgi:hypothetical protein